MVKINVKGREFEAISIRDSFNRRALKFKNNIIATLGKLGLTIDDIEIELEVNCMKKAPASASWYIDNAHLHFSHNSRPKYVENMYVVFKVIEFEVNELIEERITMAEFIRKFEEDTDIAKKREKAREVLGLDAEVNDVKVIDKVYKELAKEHHPDKEKGSIEKFKEINRAHKILKKELT